MLPCLTKFTQDFIFSIGGVNKDSVHIYRILENSWVRAPTLKLARYNASSCELGPKVYVFGGLTQHGSMVFSAIEMIDAATVVKGIRAGVKWPEWERLDLPAH